MKDPLFNECLARKILEILSPTLADPPKLPKGIMSRVD
jgi:hypothetical protein